MLPTILAVVFALPPPVAGKLPPMLEAFPPVFSPAPVAPLPEPVAEKTEAELKEIDKRFWQQNRYRLCPGSCGMMCAAHGGGWVLEPGEAEPGNPYQAPAEPTEIKPAVKPASGHYEKRCGPNGCQQVWVPDAPAAEPSPAPPQAQPNTSPTTNSYHRFFRRRR